MRGYGIHSFAGSLFVQAAISMFFTLGPLAGTGRTRGWRAAEVLVAGAAVVVGILLRTGAVKTRPIVLGFEAVAIAFGAYGLMAAHIYLPGTIVGIGVFVRLLSMTSAPANPMPVPMPTPGPGFAQIGTPGQFGEQPPFGAPAPQDPVQPPQYPAQPPS